MAKRPPTVIQIGDRLAGRRVPAAAASATNLAKIGIRDNELERFAAIVNLHSLDDVAAFVKASMSRQIDKTIEGLLPSAEVEGGAWQWAGASGLLKGLKQPDLAPYFGKSVGHLRLCGRLFMRREGTEEPTSRQCVGWYKENETLMKFEPRKDKGLDYTWDCVRARDTYDKIVDTNPDWSQTQVFEEVDKKLTRGAITSPPTTIQNQLIRFGVITAHAMALLRRNRIESSLSRFAHMTDLGQWVATVPWDKERDLAAWDALKNVPFFRVEVADEFYDREPPSQHGGEDGGDQGGGGGQGGGGLTTPVTAGTVATTGPVTMTATLTESASPGGASVPTYTQADMDQMAAAVAARTVAAMQESQTTVRMAGAKRKAPARNRAQSS